MKALNYKAIGRARLKLVLFFLTLICTTIGSVYSYLYITMAEIEQLQRKVAEEMNEINLEQSLVEKFDSVQLYCRLMDMRGYEEGAFLRALVYEKTHQIQQVITKSENSVGMARLKGIVTCIQQMLTIEDSVHTCLTTEIQLRNEWISCMSEKSELLKDSVDK